MHTVAEVYQTLRALSEPLESIEVPLRPGLVLARPAVAQALVPAFDLSTMDGYAICAAQGHAGAWRLQQVSAPGESPKSLEPGTAMRILTGAPVPLGADTVMMQEHASITEGHVSFTRPVTAGPFIRRAGEDLKPGDVALPANMRIGAAQLSLLLSLGITKVTVFRAPRVLIVPTGSEIGQAVPESNGPALLHLFEACGGDVTLMPVVPDDEVRLRAALEAALSRADLLITVGGASVGDRDLVAPLLRDLGVTFSIEHVAVKPGKPVCIGSRDEARVIMLPGNPVSSLLTGGFFAAPLVRALAGEVFTEPLRLPARLDGEIRRSPGRAEWMRGTFHVEAGVLRARAAQNQGSAALGVTALSTCIVHVPADASHLQTDAQVDITPYTHLFGEP